MIAYTTNVNDNVNTMLANAGLNWKVQRVIPAVRPLHYAPGVDGPSFQTVDNYRFLRRSDTGEIFAAVSDQYQPHQNTDIIRALDDVAGKLGTRIRRLGLLHNGRYVFAQIDLNKSFQVSKHDRTDGFLTVTTRHDATGKTRGGGTYVCIVCQNTFQAAERDLSAVVSHRGNAGRVAVVMQAALESAAEGFGVYQRQAEALSQLPIKSPQALLDWVQRITDPAAAQKRDTERGMTDGDLLAAILDAQETRIASQILVDDMLNRKGKAVLDAIINGNGQDDPARKDTWWGAFQGATYYADHTARSRTADNRTVSAWSGPLRDFKADALELALLASGASALAA